MLLLRSTFLLFLFILCALGFAQDRPTLLPQDAWERLQQQGFKTEDLQDLVVKDDYRSDNGVQHTFLRQRWQGIEVWNGDIGLHRGANGSLVALNVAAFSHMAKRVNTSTPAIGGEQALRSVLSRTLPGASVPTLLLSEDAGRRLTYDGTLLGNEPVRVQLVYQPVGERLHLAWNVNHYTPDGSHWWNVRIDALTGEELDRNDWVANCAFDHDHAHRSCAAHAEALEAPAAPNDYRVLGWPVESPSHGTRTLRNAPWLDGGIASPYGWHDNNGAAGAEYTDTRGNNCRAQEDTDANNTGGFRPSGGATLDFDFPMDLTQAPSTYQSAAITNLFYWNNLMHDVWYGYGFNEVAGNFQQNNYGRGGTGNDWVNADAQDGSGTNNANFGTPPDGSNPRMQMFRWTYTTPERDSDLDNGIIAHEYGHGISNRLVGGPSNTSCLSNAEQMGEGWSDFFGLVMTIKSGDTGAMPRGVGTYVLGQPTTGGGIRPAPYSTSFSVNGYTYANTNSGVSQPHGIGFVWCTMLWEMTWELIGVHGLNTDIYSGTGGNNIAMRLVIEGLKLTPCNPGFVDARDAILQADLNTFGGANQGAIWAAFARRGLGFSASQGSSASRTDQVEAFDTPLANNVGIFNVVGPIGTLLDCPGTPRTVSATVRNFGQSAQSNFPLRYRLDAGAWVTETFTGTLAPGASAVFAFAQTLTLTGLGAHTLTVGTLLTGDQYPGNDAITAGLELVTATTLNAPFLEDVQGGSATPPGWTIQNPDAATTWGTTVLTNGPLCAASTAWSINHYSYNAPGQEDRLVSPLVNLAGVAGGRLKFHRAYAGYSASYPDGFRVEVSNNCGTTWTTLYQATGAALQTTAYSTSNWTPTNCSQWQLNDIDISAYDGQLVQFRFVAINGYGNWFYLDNVQVENNGVRLAVKLMLEGPYDPLLDRMRDDLRSGGLLPTQEPYTSLGFTQVGGGGETIVPGATATTGDNAIVDWVLVELRSTSSPSTIVDTRSALVQRDGDVVASDGVSPITLLAAAGSYHVAVRHRNHLGCMTASPLALTGTPLTVDLTLAGTTTYGTDARKLVNGRMMLWAGNVVRDNALKYSGFDNDRDPILITIGGSVPTNTVPSVYSVGDVNLDGTVRYSGSANDRDPILVNIGGSVPTNTRLEQLP
ncbi:MAG: M36 family metallopeptidase [Flavobacteriales bacterium]|nr:M36 family metallopeptidase [Flavobacteriales bacterium]